MRVLGDAVITKYVYDNEDILLEYACPPTGCGGTGTETLQAHYTHGPGIDEPLILTRGAQNLFYHPDGLGSITALTDSTGAVVERYTYDSFGNLTITDATGSALSASAFGNSYAFTAREFDPESKLHYYRRRYYDPALGRFLQEDPVGFFGGINFYTYALNNPLRYIDPHGLLNILFGGGGSVVGITGAEASGGIVINPGFGNQKAGEGIFGTIGAGAGLNVSSDLFVGVIFGGLNNVSGTTVNFNFVGGPFSVSAIFDARTGGFSGFTLGLGPGIPIGFSTTVATTGILAVQEGDAFAEEVAMTDIGGQCKRTSRV